MFHFYLCAGAPLMLLVPLGTDVKAISPLPVVLSIKLVRVSIHNTVWRTTGAPGMSDGRVDQMSDWLTVPCGFITHRDGLELRPHHTSSTPRDLTAQHLRSLLFECF
ncbi:hypothetical protein PAPYR_7377 [Paratrimastix pyriformis]|uniref:Secreted protein n=1 Tax=Paratrimastix pyriformis TaxID=342808 RepID=A0ABQ8UD81_9EUKA|nr:hypothetical protein PAPYR_7377 [Paratrimastix pyriformis]